MIEQFKDKEGGYIYDGISFEDAESLVLSGMLGFCGCGAPDLAGDFLLKVLQSIQDRNDDKITWQQRDAICSADEGIRYFVYYTLDKFELTEHGGSVNGSWLTEKGELVLQCLKDVYNETIHDEHITDCTNQ